MKKTLLLLLPLLLLSAAGFIVPDTGFSAEQKKNARVKTAYSEKYETMKKALADAGLDIKQVQIAFRALKKEKKFEVWAKNKGQGKYILLKTYDICSSSGGPGPKRRGGDGQVPEGFYHVNRFNPYSNFYLSLGVNYPNASDRILGYKQNLGGDIFIHGSCVTIGCIPLTDEFIKEVYLLAVEAKNNGQGTIPVMIFPCRMDKDGMKYLQESLDEAGGQEALLFWNNIKEGYDLFDTNHKVPSYTVDKEGKYKFTE